jgi:outer membrane protein TolC
LQQDVLLAHLELSKLLETEISLHGEYDTAVAQLNALLYRDAATPVALPAAVNESLAPVADGRVLVARAIAARPQLAAQHQQVAAAGAQVELAQRDYRPDFMLGASYEWRDGTTDMKGVMFAMSLPLRAGSRQDRALDQRNAELLVQRYGLQDMEARLAADVAAARADYASARQRSDLLRSGVLPQASQTVAAMMAGYQVGKVDFLNLSQAQITLYEYEIRYWQVLSDAWTALARLVATVGEERVYE